MGKERTTEPRLSETASLIDFLYVDKERVDSLVSQLYHGALRSVTKTTSIAQKTQKSVKGEIPVLKGRYSNENKDTSEAAEQYDPYHSQLIQLLNDLSLPIIDALPYHCIGNLMLIRAPIQISDLHSLKRIFTNVEKTPSVLGPTNIKETKANIKMVNGLLSMLDDSIGLSLIFDNHLIKGTLREGGLSIKQSDLNRTYGISLPGEWYILGIVDSNCHTQLPSNSPAIETIIDTMSNAVNAVYSSSQYSIIPILIYREITYTSSITTY
jgi:hypothetical protein